MNNQTVEILIRELLNEIEGGSGLREGLQETPERVARAFQQWFGGYETDPVSVLKVFEDGAEGCDEMVVVKDIPIWSHCEHHIAPFFGHATIAYIPDRKIVGLSKLTRLANVYMRRLQVQERLTTQIADTLQNVLQPLGVGVYLDCRHACVESRGVMSQNQHTVTSKLHGLFKDDPAVRHEFLALARG